MAWNGGLQGILMNGMNAFAGKGGGKGGWSGGKSKGGMPANCNWGAQGASWSHGQRQQETGWHSNDWQMLAGKGGYKDAAKDAAMAAAYQAGLQHGKKGNGKGKGKGKGKGGGGGGKSAQPVSWKGELRRAVLETKDEAFDEEEDIVYTTVEDDSGFVCCTTFQMIHNSYESEGVCHTKKMAEESAAKMALQGEFPELFRKAQGKVQSNTQLGNVTNVLWKTRFNQAFGKRYKVNCSKDSILYTTVEDADGKFTSSLSSDKFENAHAGEMQPSKRLAEESAAMVALEAEFPNVYNSFPEEARKLEVELVEKQRGVKIKNDPYGHDSAGKDPKSQLNQGMTIIVERSLTKGDAVYSSSKSNGMYTAVVTLHCLVEPQSFTGEPAAEQKAAEANAARAALEEWTDAIEEKRPEWEARKIEKKAAFAAAKALENEGKEPPAKRRKANGDE